MTRLQKILGITAAAFVLGFGSMAGGWALAAAAGGPPVIAPSSGPGPYYSGPVHLCVSAGGAVYVELHSTTLGNCAAGYRQLTVNELTPAFTLTLGAIAYQCTAATAQPRTAIVCTVPPPPPPSPSSTASPG